MAQSQKPDNVHLLNGTYRADRHGDIDSKPEWSEDLPEMPEYLDKRARKEWRSILLNAPVGVIIKTDNTILAQFCMLVSKLAKQKHEFNSTDHTQLKLIGQQLGFTPGSRGKIGGAPKKNNDGGPQVVPR